MRQRVLLDDFGTRALRRPLTTEERTAYDGGSTMGPAAPRASSLADVRDPAGPFIRLPRSRSTAKRGQRENYYRLAAYDVASRLSYHFGKPCPTRALRVAANCTLLTDEVYNRAGQPDVRRRAYPRGDQRLFTRNVACRLAECVPHTPALQTLAQGTTIFDPGADHFPAMTDEIRAMTEHFTFTTPGSYKDLLLSDLTFTRSPHLAELYGVKPWDGSSPYQHMPAASGRASSPAARSW